MLRNFVFSGSSALESVGVLDMGGASAQVSCQTNCQVSFLSFNLHFLLFLFLFRHFQIASAAIAPPRATDDSMTTVTVPGYIPTQYVYSKSVLGAGMTVARQLLRLGIVEATAAAEGEGSFAPDQLVARNSTLDFISMEN
jgi:hypothetical protein